MSISRVLVNAFHLALTQLASFFIPFLALPFLSRNLTVDEFGLTMIMLSIVQFGYLFTEYGQNISASKRIIENKFQLNITQVINGSVVGIKLLVSTVYVLTVYIAFSETFDTELFILIFFAVILQAFQPLWLLTAYEKFGMYSKVLIVSKLLYLATLLILINYYKSHYMVLLSLILSYACVLILSKILLGRHNIELTMKLNLKDLWYELKKSFPFFMSRILSNYYYFILTPIVAKIFGTTISSQFAAPDNIFKASRGLSTSIIQAAFPYLSKNKEMRQLLKLLLIGLIPVSIGCLILITFSDEILLLVFGEQYLSFSIILNHFSFLIFLSYANAFLGYPAYTIINELNRVNVIGIISGALFVILLVIMSQIKNLSIYSVLNALICVEIITLLIKIVDLILLRKRGVV